MDIDTPLDEVISKARKDRKSAARKSKATKPAKAAAAAGARTVSSTSRKARSHATPAVREVTVKTVAAQAAPGPESAKIVVSNLPADVTEPQLKELFESTIGHVKKASLAFNSQGRSTGVATVEFRKLGDGSKACKEYNGRLIDNKRRMKVEIIVDPARLPKPPLSTRLAPAPKEAKGSKQSTSTAAAAPAKEGKGRAKKAGGKGNGTGRSGSAKQKPMTAAELDAQMDQHMMGAGDDAAAAA